MSRSRLITESRIGASNELLVASDLIRRGYEVYRNVSPSGGDLIVQKAEQLFEVEVTAGMLNENGKVYYDKHRHRSWHIIAVVVEGQVRYYDRGFNSWLP
jgi:hypothetical protein